MHDDASNTDDQATLAELERTLWEPKLYDPAVFKELERQRAALRWMTPGNVVALVALAAVALWLSVWWHSLFAVFGILVGLIAVYRKGRTLTLEQERLDHLIGPPGIAFPSIAVNKIEAEARDRSQNLEDYIRRVNSGGRYCLTDFEVGQIVQILSVLDRLDAQ